MKKILSLVKAQRVYKVTNCYYYHLNINYRKKNNKELTIVNFIKDNVHNEILYDEQTVFPIEFLVLYGEELKKKITAMNKLVII